MEFIDNKWCLELRFLNFIGYHGRYETNGILLIDVVIISRIVFGVVASCVSTNITLKVELLFSPQRSTSSGKFNSINFLIYYSNSLSMKFHIPNR